MGARSRDIFIRRAFPRHPLVVMVLYFPIVFLLLVGLSTALVGVVDLDTAYANNLTYECRPDAGTEEYNSNSYAAGLLNAADIPLPSFPMEYYALFPGWTKRVPAVHFGRNS